MCWDTLVLVSKRRASQADTDPLYPHKQSTVQRTNLAFSFKVCYPHETDMRQVFTGAESMYMSLELFARFECTVKRADGGDLTADDNVAVENLPLASFFNSAELYIGDTKVTQRNVSMKCDHERR